MMVNIKYLHWVYDVIQNKNKQKKIQRFTLRLNAKNKCLSSIIRLLYENIILYNYMVVCTKLIGKK